MHFTIAALSLLFCSVSKVDAFSQKDQPHIYQQAKTNQSCAEVGSGTKYKGFVARCETSIAENQYTVIRITGDTSFTGCLQACLQEPTCNLFGVTKKKTGEPFACGLLYTRFSSAEFDTEPDPLYDMGYIEDCAAPTATGITSCNPTATVTVTPPNCCYTEYGL